MEPCQHDSKERIRIAQISGTAMRHAVKLANGRGNFDEAVAELHTISTDPHLLAHGQCGDGYWPSTCIRALLEAAGAAPEYIEAFADELLRRTYKGDRISAIAEGIQRERRDAR